MKSRIAAVAFCACCTAMAAKGGNVCTWTGGGYDARWSNAANWDVLPASGNGDTLVFTNEHELVCINDSESFSLSRLYFSGSGSVRVAAGGGAGEICFASAVTCMTNLCKVVFDVPVRVGSPSGNTEFRFCGGAVFNGEIAINGAGSLRFSKTEALLPRIEVNGGIAGPEATFNVRIGRNASGVVDLDAPLAVNSTIRVKTLEWAGGYVNNFGYLSVPGGEWSQARVGYGNCFAGCENAFATNMVMSWSGYYRSPVGAWNMNGFNQTIDRIWSESYPTNASGVLYAGGDRLVSGPEATLTMRATGDGRCWGLVTGAVSLVWAPVDPSFTMDFDNRAHPSTGGLHVLGGTMKVSRAGSFASASDIHVASGATFHLNSTVSGALAGVRDMVLEGTGAFRLSPTAADPFDAVRVQMTSESALEVSEGAVLALGALWVDGVRMDNGTYSGTGWIKGGGSVLVDSSRLAAMSWKAPKSGMLYDGSNWTGGSAPSVSGDVLVDVAGEPYTVGVADGTSVAGSLTFGASAIFAPSGRFSQNGGTLSVIRSGKVNVASGCEYDFVSDVSWRDPDVSVQVQGGEISVDGGVFRADPFYGRFVVGGSSPGGRGRISVKDGSFTISPWQSSSGGSLQQTMRVQSGGLVDVSGSGVFFCKAYGWGTIPLLLEDGEISVTDNGRFLVNGQVQHIRGYGKINFSGDSMLTLESADQAPGLCLAGRGKYRTLDVRFGDRSKLDIGLRGSFSVQSGEPMSRQSHAGSGVTLTLDSDADHVGGSFMYVGAYYGPGVLNMKRGTLALGGRGLGLGLPNDTSENPKLGPDGTLNLSGGTVDINGSYAMEASSTYLSGVVVGSSLPQRADKFLDGCRGRINIGGGTLRCRAGNVLLGVGHASGSVDMTGGTFMGAADNSSVNVFGFLDGTGIWTQSAGSAVFSNSVHVGGMPLSGLFNAAVLAVGTAADTGSARGSIEISGGSFATEKALVLGASGTGKLVVKGTGVVSAKDLVVSNALSSVTIVAGNDGIGQVRISGSLDAAEGAVLTVDATGLDAENLARGVNVLTCATASRQFSNVVFKGDGRRIRLIRSPGRIRLAAYRGGCLIVR